MQDTDNFSAMSWKKSEQRWINMREEGGRKWNENYRVATTNPHQVFIGNDCFKSKCAPTELQIPERA